MTAVRTADARGIAGRILAVFVLAAMTASCAEPKPTSHTRWDAYYARAEQPEPSVAVMPPDGTSVPMAKLIARYVAENLKTQGITAEVGGITAPPSGFFRGRRGGRFLLTGVAENGGGDPRSRYGKVIRWMLTDADGRVVATHTQGVDGTAKEWDFGSARLLNEIGIGAAGAVAQMVTAETGATAPLDPLRRGVLAEGISGVPARDAEALMAALKRALRKSDVLVTGDARQASFRLNGAVKAKPARSGQVSVRITWTVTDMNRRVLGRAVQENTVAAGAIADGWAELAPRIGEAAAVGVVRVFGVRPGPPFQGDGSATDMPPAVVLPGAPGRALPPPR